VQALHERAAGLAVVGVASDPPEEVRALAAEIGLTFPLAIESAPWEVSGAYGLSAVPTLVLVDRDGTVLLASAGFSRDDFLAIARIAGGRSGSAPADPFPEGAAVPAFRPG
jgi:peroxiredoxin